MDVGLFLVIGLCLLIIGFLSFIIFRKKQARSTYELDYNNIIQKKTHIKFFNLDGILVATTPSNEISSVLDSLKTGQHISECVRFKNLEKYFESCKKFKKNITLKLIEEKENELGKRLDLIFSPLIENDTVTGIMVLSQELISHNREQQHLTQHKELEEQRNYAFKQIDEIEAQKSELELAFKKSSKHHIMLQKAMRKIEIQKTELEQAIEIINQQKVDLEKANREIRESSRMKEIFLANTSHEIRTPLNAIIGFTNLLLSTSLDLSQKKYLENIKASGNNLLVVINDILDFSKIESGKLSLEQIEFNIRNLIKHTFSTLAVKSQEKNIQLKESISPEIPEIMIGDPVRLNQILINLLGNAIKFTNPNGNVRLLATLGQPFNDKIKVLFKVEDNGIGIHPEKLQEIFQSFTQGESDTTRKYGGTGLGLSIVKQLIELQEGEISVESEVGHGTTFTFYIMLKEGKIASESHVKHQINRSTLDNPQDIHILLVEDNLINQQLAYDTIKTWNNQIHVDLAENGKIALEKVEKNDYQIILMDIQMPLMDGNEATKHIRELPSPKNAVPIVAMTAHALKMEKNNCLENGMDDYISKPFDPEELFAKIIQYASKNKPTNQMQSKGDTLLTRETNEHKEFVSETHFQFFNLTSLRKIYQNNDAKILKIVQMCHESIPNEIIEIYDSFHKEEWEVLRNKAHSLKPKLGYLGMNQMQEHAKNIELEAQTHNKPERIKELIQTIETYWKDASVEIEQLIASNKTN